MLCVVCCVLCVVRCKMCVSACVCVLVRESLRENECLFAFELCVNVCVVFVVFVVFVVCIACVRFFSVCVVSVV